MKENAVVYLFDNFQFYRRLTWVKSMFEEEWEEEAFNSIGD